MHGLSAITIGDPVGVRGRTMVRPQFPPPPLETVVEPCRRADRGALHAALAELDSLIDLRGDDVVSLYGEVQKGVIEATLAEQYGLAVTFRATTTRCVERLIGRGEAYELNPFLATVGLRVLRRTGGPS